MRKNSIGIIILLPITLLFGSCNMAPPTPQKEIVLKTEVPEETAKTQTPATAEEIQSKIGMLRGRYAIQGLVQNGDTYLENKQLTLALKNYLSALKQNKDDPIIINKIAETYFEMKRYSIAYNYYKNLKTSEIVNKNIFILSYIYTLDLTTTGNLASISETIKTFGFSPEDTFFYIKSFSCIQSIASCSNSFLKYSETHTVTHAGIGYTEKAIKNYDSFQVDTPYLRNTKILAALFQSKLYPITNIMGEKILSERPGYLPVIKIIAKGYFEMGDYENAKKYLLLHNEFDSKDPKVNYMLGIVNIKLHEYVLSNIYFIKALKEGFTPHSTISRRLIYNYYLIEDMDKVLKEFKSLIESGEANELDYSLGIYYSLINDQKRQANKWVDSALKIFSDSDIFYGYKGWILKDDNNLSEAERFLKLGHKINAHNPLINLNLGIIEYKKGNVLKAKIYLKNTIGEDPSGAFGKAASQELINIQNQEEQRETNLQKQLDAQLQENTNTTQ